MRVLKLEKFMSMLARVTSAAKKEYVRTDHCTTAKGKSRTSIYKRQYAVSQRTVRLFLLVHLR